MGETSERMATTCWSKKGADQGLKGCFTSCVNCAKGHEMRVVFRLLASDFCPIGIADNLKRWWMVVNHRARSAHFSSRCVSISHKGE